MAMLNEGDAEVTNDAKRGLDERCIIDFDHHSRSFNQDPYRFYSEIRSSCPVAYSTAWGGFWVVSTYDAVTQAFRDDETLSNAHGLSIPSIGQPRPLLPLEMDPPDYFKYRFLLNPLFTPGRIQSYEPDARVLVTDLIDRFVDTEEVDFVEALSDPLSTLFTLRMLGMEEEKWAEYKSWVDTMNHEYARDRDRAFDAGLSIYAALAEEFERHEEARDSGIISFLLDAELEGRRLTEEEMLDMAFLLFIAGIDTTSAAIANTLLYLGRNPDHRRRLIGEPALMPSAIEEFLRYEAPVHCGVKTAARDFQLGETSVGQGEKLMFLIAAANRDEAEFPDADSVVLDRHPNRHLAFGIGVHRCLGAHVARLLMRVALEEVLRRVPGYEIAEDGVERYDDVSIIYALHSLPVRLWPSGRQAS